MVNILRFLLLKIIVVFLIVDKNVKDVCGLGYVDFIVILNFLDILVIFIWY